MENHFLFLSNLLFVTLRIWGKIKVWKTLLHHNDTQYNY